MWDILSKTYFQADKKPRKRLNVVATKSVFFDVECTKKSQWPGSARSAA